MSEVINLLSSDEEDLPPPQKRIKPTLLNDVRITPIVIVSDEDDVPEKKKSDVNNDLKKENMRHSMIVKDDDTDSITFIDGKNGINNDNNFIIEHNSNKENNIKHDSVFHLNNKLRTDKYNSEDSSGKENIAIVTKNTTPENNNTVPSTSKDSPDMFLEKFLTVCGNSINKSQYEHLKDKQFPIIRKYYKKCGSKLSESSNFIKLIEENKERAQKSPAAAVISFNDVFQYIKEVMDAESIEVSHENRIKLKKLEKTIKLLIARIKHLEDSELNFDDEEDSTYLQLHRYTNRLSKVYEKYCQLLKKNPHSGRITYEKLDFVDSEYNDINRAISKKYKNNKKFPSYIEMEEFIKKIVEEHNLGLSEVKIKSESVRCFKKLGELLQNRRKRELYDTHYTFIRNSEDPAKQDVSLDLSLKQNFAESQIKIEKICEEFVIKEDHGEEAELSEEDSDKSDYIDSENENKD